MMNDAQIAQLVTALRFMVDQFSDAAASTADRFAIDEANAALAVAPLGIHLIANDIENEWEHSLAKLEVA